MITIINSITILYHNYNQNYIHNYDQNLNYEHYYNYNKKRYIELKKITNKL